MEIIDLFPRSVEEQSEETKWVQSDWLDAPPESWKPAPEEE